MPYNLGLDCTHLTAVVGGTVEYNDGKLLSFHVRFFLALCKPQFLGSKTKPLLHLFADVATFAPSNTDLDDPHLTLLLGKPLHYCDLLAADSHRLKYYYRGKPMLIFRGIEGVPKSRSCQSSSSS